MTRAARSLVLIGACVLTVLLILLAAKPDGGRSERAAAAPTVAADPAITEEANTGKFFFDVKGHSTAEFRELLVRARTIYEDTPDDARSDLEVVLVLHGPDIEFFDSARYEEHRDIVDLAAQLDAFGVFDFRMCAASAASLGLDAADVPAFIEFVPYGPAEVRRLTEAGFLQL